MSSINPHFTFNYLQPDEYHFSHDSVFLARKVFELIRDQNIEYRSILDLCSGCGVVGLDLLHHLKNDDLNATNSIDFIDIQDIYLEYFNKNIKTLALIFSNLPSCNFLNLNYEQIKNNPLLKSKYDLIVCNPPYFRVSQGALSQSNFKNRCRFFIDSTFADLIYSIEYSLSETGSAFVLLKSLTDHSICIEKEFELLNAHLNLTKISVIRNTDLFKINRKT
ncbi:MAG: methyltransferase [Pseudobdellovibrio sp.]